ncbi:HNH endonuclease [Mycobacterium sp. NPDC050441]|uniref:HNH endonuclease n=1 Tax=Mycobacterium sp. NPDC050441 TaxID=3155403 RepID=UPI0033FCCE15
MRQLTKGDKPAVLVANEDAWTQEYLHAVATDDPKKHEHWRHPEIKDGLHAETSGKCAYCEALVSDVSYPHVEHIIPKSPRPELAHRWHNLTWACPVCNGNKREYYDEQYAVLNPYADDPDNHIMFTGCFVSQHFGASRGEITIKKLKLNRPDLVYARAERLSKLREMVERWYEADGARKDVLAEAIRIDADEGEFSASVIQYLNDIGFPIGLGVGQANRLAGDRVPLE